MTDEELDEVLDNADQALPEPLSLAAWILAGVRPHLPCVTSAENV